MRFHVAFKAFKPHHKTYFTRLTQVEKKCYQDVLLSIFFFDDSVTARIRWWFDLKTEVCTQKYPKKCNVNIALFYLFCFMYGLGCYS